MNDDVIPSAPEGVEAPQLTETETTSAPAELSTEELFEWCKDLALEPRILDRFAVELERAGVVGEERAGKLIFLVLTSRLLEKPLAAIVKGPSTGGKSWVTERVLQFFPPEAYYTFSAMSPKVLAYGTEPIAHRTLYIAEQAGIPREAEYLVRTLLSEGRLDYKVVECDCDGHRSVREISRKGPVGLITTTTRIAVHPENETRLLSIPINDSNEQTRAVFRSIAAQPGEEVDFDLWHNLQKYLATTNHSVFIPFAPLLAEMIPDSAIRLRRDFGQLLNLMRAHALLHRASRKEDAAGRIVARLDDYVVVRGLAEDLMGADGGLHGVPRDPHHRRSRQGLPWHT